VSRALIFLAALAVAGPAHGEVLALRCPMVMIAAESLYEIDFTATTVRLTNLVAPVTMPAAIDERSIAWRNGNAFFRLDRSTNELMQAPSEQGPWELGSSCVRL
jgi:hypothetical protein